MAQNTHRRSPRLYLGPLLFNIFINDLFLSIEKCELCNYADDNTLYASQNNLDRLISDLQYDFKKMSNWFENNSMILNPDKCHFMLFGTSEKKDLYCDDKVIKQSPQEAVLGIIIDDQLSFQPHMEKLFKTINQKLNALTRESLNMGQNQIKLLVSSLILSRVAGDSLECNCACACVCVCVCVCACGTVKLQSTRHRNTLT